jgi:DNA-binding HxlR family transcriptional regulator
MQKICQLGDIVDLVDGTYKVLIVMRLSHPLIP